MARTEADTQRRGTPAAHARRKMGDREKFTDIDRASKNKRSRTIQRTSSKSDSRNGRHYDFGTLSPTAMYLTLLAGLLCFGAFMYWTVVIAWAPA